MRKMTKWQKWRWFMKNKRKNWSRNFRPTLSSSSLWRKSPIPRSFHPKRNFQNKNNLHTPNFNPNPNLRNNLYRNPSQKASNSCFYNNSSNFSRLSF
jgi:hypothetical protein